MSGMSPARRRLVIYAVMFAPLYGMTSRLISGYFLCTRSKKPLRLRKGDCIVMGACASAEVCFPKSRLRTKQPVSTESIMRTPKRAHVSFRNTLVFIMSKPLPQAASNRRGEVRRSGIPLDPFLFQNPVLSRQRRRKRNFDSFRFIITYYPILCNRFFALLLSKINESLKIKGHRRSVEIFCITWDGAVCEYEAEYPDPRDRRGTDRSPAV